MQMYSTISLNYPDWARTLHRIAGSFLHMNVDIVASCRDCRGTNFSVRWNAVAITYGLQWHQMPMQRCVSKFCMFFAFEANARAANANAANTRLKWRFSNQLCAVQIASSTPSFRQFRTLCINYLWTYLQASESCNVAGKSTLQLPLYPTLKPAIAGCVQLHHTPDHGNQWRQHIEGYANATFGRNFWVVRED